MPHRKFHHHQSPVDQHDDGYKIGLSVAMKNGSDAIKAVAMYQTDYDNNEDGVAHFIEDRILKTDD
ncbi:HAD hydrolase family protein [Faecalicoccus pleomorphus]|uniref:HAD hydrolase family protein n=1 Tax=Faecalicoccus pleomorphus TaxID=1323 RepID=UPI0030B84F5D